ncbi:hypothetical protein J3458_001318 [Metarhizium acridum]|uniref:uncharacterized protein n=1 Tax=Metarhizium acridum TaxID=92637 RepID=UPI001C6C4A27|nr:hypothetical protein J3458_001318 [Metarhizium acridum]
MESFWLTEHERRGEEKRGNLAMKYVLWRESYQWHSRKLGTRGKAMTPGPRDAQTRSPKPEKQNPNMFPRSVATEARQRNIGRGKEGRCGPRERIKNGDGEDLVT